jgi:hypothetical protein
MGRDEVDSRFEPRRLQIGHQTPGDFGWQPGRSIRPARYFDGVSLKIFPSFIMTAKIFAVSSGFDICAIARAHSKAT